MDSHMLKHALSEHEDKTYEEVRLRVRVIKYTRSSFERQISESSIMQEDRKYHNLHNS